MKLYKPKDLFVIIGWSSPERKDFYYKNRVISIYFSTDPLKLNTTTYLIKIIRELTDVYIPPSNFLATPFIAYSENTPNFVLNHEVAKVIEVSVYNIVGSSNNCTHFLCKDEFSSPFSTVDVAHEQIPFPKV